MNREEFLKYCDDRIVFLDGATGTNLQKKGLPSGVCPESWILEHTDVMKELQRAYSQAGSDIVYAPTFTGNRIKLSDYWLESDIVRINSELVKLTKGSVSRDTLVAGDLTMTGRQLKPVGDLDFEELIEVYKEQISILQEAGCDILVVETMMSLQECRAALIAAKELSDMAVMVTLTFEAEGRTLFGSDPESCAICLEALGAAAVGANCSTGPDRMEDIIRRMASVTRIPIIAKPNAGLPCIGSSGETEYDMDRDTFVRQMKGLINCGASIIGGCCGTTPDFIRGIKEAYSDLRPSELLNESGQGIQRKISGRRYLCSERKSLSFDLDCGFMIVGERINPTGKKKLQEELRSGSLDIVSEYARSQESEGASILDINVGMGGIDECSTMLNVITEVTSISDLPLCIDTSSLEVMEKALRIYPGRALINSISLEKGKAESFLPLAKKYGAMFILLPLSPEGLPKDLKEKTDNIDKLSRMAYDAGLEITDIVVDGLVATVGADPEAAKNTLDTISYCYERGFATVCGLSNISFGLPQRMNVNTAFLTMAISRGLTMAIANPSQEMLVNAAFASDLLLNKEGAAINYIGRMERYNDTSGKKSDAAVVKETSGEEKDFFKIIKKDVLGGSKRSIVKDTESALSFGLKARDILDRALMPAINEVGELFDKGKYFLPQLIAGAEAMKLSIEVLEPHLQKDGSKAANLPTIVIATVQGDIHDIGKNLVALMLRNYGFNVIDLGKDVPREEIIRAARENNASIIALSALMTTTMKEMKNVIDYARDEKLDCRIIVGGAVVTREYADEIGADGYSCDAADTVRVVKQLLNI
ncbi:MAG: homocysteine S-methyltransferase family protein [Butyrivibrio sp.]|nr:homocysteine S-methyltransferase family protein [Butyrivibrio sp.]